MESNRPEDIGDNIVKIAGFNIFENTRKRKHVEYRALLCFLLREKLLMRWTNIANFFKSKGKDMDHATCIHLVKMYPIYKKDNKKLDEIENMFIFKSHLNYDEIDKVHYLENKYNNMEKKYLTLAEQLNNPLIKDITSLPKHRQEDVREKIDALKKSWVWKQKLNK
jgi:hypothetical protein